MEFSIARMTPQDYDEVVRLWQSAPGVGLTEADSRESIARYLRRNPGISLVARRAGQLVGAVLGGHDGRRGYVHHLAVAPECRRQGVGRVLAEGCLAALRRAGIRRCHIFVMRENAEGQAFWQALGWKRRDDLQVMSRDIEPA